MLFIYMYIVRNLKLIKNEKMKVNSKKIFKIKYNF